MARVALAAVILCALVLYVAQAQNTTSRAPPRTTTQALPRTTSRGLNSTTRELPRTTTRALPRTTTRAIPRTTSRGLNATTRALPRTTTRGLNATTRALPRTTSRGLNATTRALPRTTTRALPRTTSRGLNATTRELPRTTSRGLNATTRALPRTTTRALPRTSRGLNATTRALPRTTTRGLNVTTRALPRTTSRGLNATTRALPRTTTRALPRTTSRGLNATTRELPRTTSRGLNATTRALPRTTTRALPRTTSRGLNATTRALPRTTTRALPRTTSRGLNATTRKLPLTTTRALPRSTTRATPRTTTRATPRTTTTSGTWVTKTLSVDQKKKFNDAFDKNSTTLFTGTSMFDSKTGNMSKEFIDILDSREKQIVGEIQSTWKDIINMSGAFKDSLPEDLQFFVQEFQQLNKAKLLKFTNYPNTVTLADLKDIPLSIIGAINETTLMELLSQLPDTVMAGICRMLQNDESDYDTTKRIAKGVNCSDSLGKLNILPKGSLSEAIAENEMEKEEPSQWSDRKWAESISQGWFSGLPVNVIDMCPPRVLKDNIRDVTKLLMNLDEQLKERVFEKIKNATGGYDQMSANDMKNMGDMLSDMSIKDMKKLNASAVRDSLSTFRSKSSSMNRVQKMQMKKTLKDGMPAVANWTGDEIANSILFLGRDKTLIKKLDIDAISRNISDIGKQDMDPKSSRILFKKLRESPEFNESSAITTETFKKLGKIATGLSPRFMKNLTNVDFGDLLNDGSLQNLSFSKDNARAIVERIKNDTGKLSGNLNSTELTKLGKSVKGLRKEEIDNIDADELADALDTIKDIMSEIMDDMDTTTVDSIINKLVNGTGGLGGVLEKMGSLLQKVSVKKLKSLNDSDFGDMSGRTERNFNCSKTTCPELYERVAKIIGRPGLKNTNMKMTVFRNLKKVMCGMPLDDLKAMPATRFMEDLAGYLLQLKCLSDKQERILAEKIKYRLGFFSNSLRTIRRQDIKKFGGLFKHFKYSDLKRFDNSLCKDIALELGAQDLSNVRKDDLAKLAQFAVECIGKTTGKFNSEDMTHAGDLVCGLVVDRINDIDDDAMQDVLNNVQKKCTLLTPDERSEWAKKAMAKLNITSLNIQDVDDVDLIQLGSFLADIGDEFLNNIPSDKMSSIAIDVVDQINELMKQLETRDGKGFGGDVSTDDRNNRDAKKKKLFEKIINSFLHTSNSRRRRSDPALTCDDMQLLGSGVTALSTSQIEATVDSEFLDCASFLGAFSTWTSQQIQSLLTVAIRSGTYGTTSGWTADHVYNAGIITQGLTATELSALTALTIDAMYSTGRHDGWTETQLSSGFSRWLNLNKADDASTITSTELIALGHFACGATTTHIGLVLSTEYSYAASYIGELTSCTESQLEAYSSLAKTAFGDVTTWDTSVITTIGTVIGGLSATELESLTLTQLAAIEPSSISKIPASAFVGFTVSQLSSFSVAQAQSTTSNQQAGLSSDQLDALISAGATVQSTSAAADVHLSAMVIFLTISITTLKQLLA